MLVRRAGASFQLAPQPGEADVPTATRESILADMEREIEAAVDRAFTRLETLSPADEQPASEPHDEGSQPPPE